jgi:hypothetical protein
MPGIAGTVGSIMKCDNRSSYDRRLALIMTFFGVLGPRSP